MTRTIRMLAERDNVRMGVGEGNCNPAEGRPRRGRLARGTDAAVEHVAQAAGGIGGKGAAAVLTGSAEDDGSESDIDAGTVFGADASTDNERVASVPLMPLELVLELARVKNSDTPYYVRRLDGEYLIRIGEGAYRPTWLCRPDPGTFRTGDHSDAAMQVGRYSGAAGYGSGRGDDIDADNADGFDECDVADVFDAADTIDGIAVDAIMNASNADDGLRNDSMTDAEDVAGNDAYAGFMADLAVLRARLAGPSVCKRIGNRLRQFLVPARWREHECEIRAALAAGRAVHITISSAAAELSRLPWALTTLEPDGKTLGSLPGVLFQDTWPGVVSVQESTHDAKTACVDNRIVLAWSDAAGPVPGAAIADSVTDICDQVDTGASGPRVISQANLVEIAQALAGFSVRRASSAMRVPVRVLQIVGRSRERADGDFELMIDDDDGTGAVALRGDRLVSMLRPYVGSLRLVILCACGNAGAGIGGAGLSRVAEAVHRAGIPSVVATRVPLSAEALKQLSAGLYRALLVQSQSLEQAVCTVGAELTELFGSQGGPLLTLYRAPDCDNARPVTGDTRPFVLRPYRGLLGFERAHAAFLHGRENDCESILAKLEELEQAGRARMLIITGPSGVGKSSLAAGAVVPAYCATHPQAEVYVMRPGGTPTGTLARILAQRRRGRPGLVIIDPLDELITVVKQASERRRFLRTLWRACQGPGGITCVATLRTDLIALGRYLDVEGGDASPDTLETVATSERHSLALALPTSAVLRRAIVEPGHRAGLRFEPGLLDALCAEIAALRAPAGSSASPRAHAPGPLSESWGGAESDVLARLSYALDLLWRHRDGAWLTMDQYRRQKGVAGALASALDTLLVDLGEAEVIQARRILVGAVALGWQEPGAETGRRRTVGELLPMQPGSRRAFWRALRRLAEARLVIWRGRDGSATIELAHMALLRQSATLQAWLADDRPKLSGLAALALWVKQYQELGTLLLGANLAYAQQVRVMHPSDINEDAETLLASSQRVLKARARRRRAVISAVVQSASATASSSPQRSSGQTHPRRESRSRRRSARSIRKRRR